MNADGERQKSGPWNKVADDGSSTATDTAVAAAAVTTAAAALQERNTAASVYVSPALRNGPVSIFETITINVSNFRPLSIYYSFKRLPSCEKAYFPISTMRSTSQFLAPLSPRRSRKRNPNQVMRRSGMATVFSGPLKLLQTLQWR